MTEVTVDKMESFLDSEIERLAYKAFLLLQLPRHDHEVEEAHRLLQLVATWRLQRRLQRQGSPYR